MTIENDQEFQEPTQGNEETQQQDNTQEESQQEEFQEEKQEVDKNDPAFIAGQDYAKSQMQNAMDKRIGKEVYKRKSMETNFTNQINDMNSKFDERFNQLNQKPLEKPNYADFTDDIEYQIAANEYIQAQTKPKSSNTPKNTVSQVAPHPNSAIDAHIEQQFLAKENVYVQANPNYTQSRGLVELYVKDNPSLVNALHESGPQIVDYLGNNSLELEELSGMSPVQMGRKLAQIESQLKPQQQTVKTKQRSEPNDKLRSSSNGAKNLSGVSQAEHTRIMNSL